MTTTQSIITMTKYEIKVKFLGLPLSCSSPTLSCARCYYTTANDEWFEQDVIVRFLGSLFTPPPPLWSISSSAMAKEQARHTNWISFALAGTPSPLWAKKFCFKWQKKKSHVYGCTAWAARTGVRAWVIPFLFHWKQATQFIIFFFSLKDSLRPHKSCER